MLYFNQPVQTAVNLREGAILCRHASTAGQQSDVGFKSTDVGTLQLAGDTATAQGDYLRTLIWANDHGMMVAIGGIAGSADAFSFLAGSRQPVQISNIDGQLNAMIARKSEAIYQFINATVIPTPPRIAFFGHSGGGAVATLLNAIFNRRKPQAVQLCASYGAPRFANDRFYDNHRNACQARIMNYGDSFCLLVPHSDESAAWRLLSSPSDLTRINRLIDGPNGIAIDQQGNLAEMSLPLGAVIFGPGDMLTAWSSPTSPARVQHAIASYVDALTIRAITAPGALPTRGPAVQQVTRQPAQATQASIAAAQRETLAGLAAADVGARVPPRRSFIQYARQGKLWVVTAGGMQVYVASTKNDARGVARILRGLYMQFWQRPYGFVSPEMLGTLILSTPPLAQPVS